MKSEEYVETVNYNGQMIMVGMDDYGQCYFLEWFDEAGIGHAESCGTYNSDYKGYIEFAFRDKTKFEPVEVEKVEVEVKDVVCATEDNIVGSDEF